MEQQSERAPLELGRIYQLGYVTTDLDEAMTYAERTFGVRDFKDFGTFDTTVAEGMARVRVAHGMMGDFIFELIQPVGGDDTVYADYLPTDRFAIRLHHAAYYIDDARDWARMKAEVGERGVRIAIGGKSPSSEYFYLDLREELGHYAEIVHRPGATAGMDAAAERRRVEAAIATLKGKAA